MVTLKVADVEGEDLRQPVNRHGRDQVGVVTRFAADLIARDQLLPMRKDGGSLAQKNEEDLEAGKFRLRFGRSKPKPVLRRGPRADHPELVEVLRHEAEDFPLPAQLGHGVHGSGMHRVDGLSGSEQNVCIEQDAHSPRPA